MGPILPGLGRAARVGLLSAGKEEAVQGREGDRGHRQTRRSRDDARDYWAGLRSWGLRPSDLVKLTGAGFVRRLLAPPTG